MQEVHVIDTSGENVKTLKKYTGKSSYLRFIPLYFGIGCISLYQMDACPKNIDLYNM